MDAVAEGEQMKALKLERQKVKIDTSSEGFFWAVVFGLSVWVVVLSWICG